MLTLKKYILFSLAASTLFSPISAGNNHDPESPKIF